MRRLSKPTIILAAGTLAALGMILSSNSLLVQAKSNVTLTILTSQGWTSNTDPTIDKLFEKKTGIKVNVQVLPAAQYLNVLQTKLNTRQGPDIFGGQSGVTDLESAYNVTQNAVDLSNQPWTKTEDPLNLQQSTYKGKVFGLTIQGGSSQWVMVYNRAIFAKLHVEPPKTFLQLLDVSRKIEASGITPMYEPGSDGWHQTLYFAEMGPRYNQLVPNLYNNLNKNKATFSKNTIFTRSLGQVQEMVTDGLWGKNWASQTDANTVNAMASGKFAMNFNSITLANQIHASNPKIPADRFGYFVLPLLDNRILNTNPAGPSLFIYSGSPHIKEAEEYFNFITQKSNLQYRLTHDPTLVDLDFPGLKTKLSPVQAAFEQNHKNNRGVVMQTAVTYFNPQWADIDKDIVGMLEGANSVSTVLQNIDQRRAEEAQLVHDPHWQ